jgi:hypothetical protein
MLKLKRTMPYLRNHLIQTLLIFLSTVIWLSIFPLYCTFVLISHHHLKFIIVYYNKYTGHHFCITTILTFLYY